MNNKITDQRQVKRLQKQNHFYKMTVLILGIVILVLLSFDFPYLLKKTLLLPDILEKKTKAPYYKEVKEIIKPLRYSALPKIMKPEVQIKLDFENKKWILLNIYNYNELGQIILEEGRYGLCGELSSHVYDRIKPLFGDDYDIKFFSTSEAGFFLSPTSSHVVLGISRNSLLGGNESYILDPSFSRYDLEEKFSSYLFMKQAKSIGFIKRREKDRVFPLNECLPILIKNDFLVSFRTKENNGKFDKDNFVFSVNASQRNNFSGRHILSLRKTDGQKDIIENKYLGNMILGIENYRRFRGKITQWFDAL